MREWMAGRKFTFSRLAESMRWAVMRGIDYQNLSQGGNTALVALAALARFDALGSICKLLALFALLFVRKQKSEEKRG